MLSDTGAREVFSSERGRAEGSNAWLFKVWIWLYKQSAHPAPSTTRTTFNPGSCHGSKHSQKSGKCDLSPAMDNIARRQAVKSSIWLRKMKCYWYDSNDKVNAIQITMHVLLINESVHLSICHFCSIWETSFQCESLHVDHKAAGRSRRIPVKWETAET